MVKLNSTTAILSDLDGVILDINYDIKFWESWLPDHVANQSNRILEEIKAEITFFAANMPRVLRGST